MRRNNILDPVRFGRIMVNDVFSNIRGLAIAGGATIGLLLIINVASVASWNDWNFHDVFFPLTMLIGGLILTGQAFKELHSRERGYMYLTLPGSHLEKFGAKLILTTLGWSLGVIVVFWLFSVLAAGVTTVLFGMAHPVFNPFRAEVWQFVRYYVVVQPVFLFGAVYFRRIPLLQTILALSVIGVVLAMIAALLARLVFFDYFAGPFWTIEWDNEFGDSIGQFFTSVFHVLKFVFLWIVPLFFWVVGYLRLRDTEI